VSASGEANGRYATRPPVGIGPRTQIARGSGAVAFGSYHNGVMTVQLSVGGTDDPAFVCLVNSVLRGILASHAPAKVWVIQIDNWFDHRWLQFSGIGIVDFQWPAFTGRYDAALDEFYQDKTTFPPFAPNRVLSQWSYVRVGSEYKEIPLPHLPHPTEDRRSEMNLQRRVQDCGPSACFLWYSSNTVSNGRGSVMVYSVEGERVDTWFAGFNRNDRWKLHATKGAGRDYVERLCATA
jgi:hypothetical protein